jgi:four helix bundle protein
MPFKFESLNVWHDAMELNDKIHSLTKDHFPKDEQFVLSPQIRRASDSIVLNIAEGCTGQSNATFKNFLNYSLRSGIEVVSCLFLARRRNYIDETLFRSIYTEIEILSKKITALRNKL